MTDLALVRCPKCNTRAYVYLYGSNPHRGYNWGKGQNRSHVRRVSHVRVARCATCGSPYQGL